MFKIRSLIVNYSVTKTNIGAGITPHNLKITSWNVNGLRSIMRKNMV